MTTNAITAAEIEVATRLVALKAAKNQLSAARESLHAARLARDANMPRCILRTKNWRSGEFADEEVCIIKKTEDLAFVRVPGGNNEVGMRVRRSKTCGRWFFGAYKELIFKGEAS